MALIVDTDRAFRRYYELVELVEAVAAADPADESTWVEWKSNLDLTTLPGACAVARAIIGFANRMPDHAQRICQGYAYVIIGAEPRSIPGVAPIDLADLEPKLLRYLADDGPNWHPQYVDVQGKPVLVIAVDPPRWGDPIHSLATTYDKYATGTVYVRGKARSVPATREQLKELQRRLTYGSATAAAGELEVSVDIYPAEGLLALDYSDADVDRWIDARRTIVTKEHRKNLLNVDTELIEKHLAECRRVLIDATLNELIGHGYSTLSVTVTNRGQVAVEGVEVTLTFGSTCQVFALGDLGDLAALPLSPKPPKRPRAPMEIAIDPTNLSAIRPRVTPTLTESYLSGAIVPPYVPSDVHIDGNTVEIDSGSIRQEKSRSSDRFHVFAHERPAAGFLTVPWTLSAKATPGLQRGELEIPVHPRTGVLMPANTRVRFAKPASDAT